MSEPELLFEFRHAVQVMAFYAMLVGVFSYVICRAVAWVRRERERKNHEY